MLLRGVRLVRGGCRWQSTWSFSSGLASLPHPKKKRGEDAAFITPSAVGVADGVGGWATKGIDSGAYSRALMGACEVSTLKNPIARLNEAYEKAQVPGSSTACLVHLEEGSMIAANLGDSGFLHCRQQDKKWDVIFESPPQCHYFNCPLQLGMDSRDQPKHADLTQHTVEKNDLIIVATDGVFDNLFTEELIQLLDHISEVHPPAPDNMQLYADIIAEVTQKVAASETRRTPFAVSARHAGYTSTTGGKMDDITVITALVQDS
ncbi:phosphatase 2C 55-like [Thraustotheca clavata]|uniref:Protein phosphatase n=1 Tax=Thraustotheca clavata TaxID=74557 RepID=A0A1V9Y7E5_9STRA|nr:phosphatase 2C 55-like [Thraustotheca clavata]